MTNEPFPDEMIMVLWKDYQLPMTYIQYKDDFKPMPEYAKRSMARNIKRVIKTGKVDSARLGFGKDLQTVRDY